MVAETNLVLCFIFVIYAMSNWDFLRRENLLKVWLKIFHMLKSSSVFVEIELCLCWKK